MQDKGSKSSKIWGAMKIVGIVIAVLGVVVAAYSGYTLVAAPHVFTHGSGGFNGTGTEGGAGFNQSRFNSGVAFRPAFGGGIYGIVIGILAILLGVVTYKYAELNIAFMSRK